MPSLPPRLRALQAVPLAVTLAACGGGDDASPDDTDDGPHYATSFTVVEVDADATGAVQLAVQACAGLSNRRLGGSVYVQREAHDPTWLEALDLTPAEVVDASTFLDRCAAAFPSCVRYAYAEQQALLPSILTAAAASGAVPLDVGLDVACDEVVFDATVELDGATPYDATKRVAERFLDRTTGLAMLNPGYDTSGQDNSSPALVRDMSPALVDLVFSQRLFTVFLVNGCVTGNPERELLTSLVADSGWPSPVAVYGYNNSWMVAGGYLYEAQTRCLDTRNMGAVASEVGNMSFFSTRRAPITGPADLERPVEQAVTYDPTKTYVAFVIGDGDNVQYLMTTRSAWLRQRVEDCALPDSTCAPLTWSISPHIARLAPDVLAWYYATSRQTGRDGFVLPPSGHLYAYPSSLNEDDQARFVTATEDDARLLGVHGTVHWDWLDTWHEAEERFLPRYARADGVVRGVFPVNVPYMFPAFPWWPDDRFFEVLEGDDGGQVVVFRPREWRGVDDSGTGSEAPFHLSPANMAAELASYPAGTVTWVYMTSDGGLSLENSFQALTKILPPNVELVTTAAATELALAAAAR